MELWVMTQDRVQLVKVDNILVIPRMEVTAEWLIMYHNSVLGAYTTKKRALEVLYEIKKILQPLYKYTSNFKKSELTGNCQWVEEQEYIPILNKVYEMPEE